jgi:hypothetical protein
VSDRFFAPLIQPSTRFEARDQLISYQEWQQLYGKGGPMETWENRIIEALVNLDKATKYAESLHAEAAHAPDAPLTVAEAIAYKTWLDNLYVECDEADTLLRWQQKRLNNLAHDAAELPTGVWMVLDTNRAFRILYSRGENGTHHSIETRPLAFWGEHRAPAEVEADIRDLRDTQADSLV